MRRVVVGLVVVVAAAGLGYEIGRSSSYRAVSLSPKMVTLVQDAQQGDNDATYLPVQLDGRWVLSGHLRTWVQHSISTTSTPFRFVGNCAALDPRLAPGLQAFMIGQIDRLFAGSLANSLRSTLEQSVTRNVERSCPNSSSLRTGPPGPIIDNTTVTGASRHGTAVVVRASVAVEDWQSGVSHRPAPGGGRLLGWRLVQNVLDSSYTLVRGHHGWRVVALAWQFAPGHGP